jgi:hypothetical protein
MVQKQTQQVLFSRRVVVVEMNVEVQSSTPYQQIVRHGALDALVGIHGAQMTEAIWMKPGSWVLELLPFVPHGIIMGDWTTSTDRPTPLGDYFHRTDLNHASFPLRRENAPYCYEPEAEDDQKDPLDCWRHKNNPWDERDFLLDSPTLVDILNRTVLVASRNSSCHDYLDAAGEYVVVLCNINCADNAGDAVAPHHYYWTNDTSTESTG